MRLVENFSAEQDANKISAFLNDKGIECHVREAEGDSFELWIEDEDYLSVAHKAVEAYTKNPEASEFRVKPKIIKMPKKDEGPRQVNVRTEIFNQQGSGGNPTLTIGMILLCVIAFMTEGAQPLFMFSNTYAEPIPEILNGQVWRLLTPIFLHGGMLHIIFNMMWLYQLGGQIENLSGSRSLLILTVVIGVISNIIQYLWSGPFFVGMSGVVYGLLGFIWARQKWGTRTQYALPDQTMGFMMIWLVICIIGIIPRVANGAHVGGLVIGVILGYVSSGHIKSTLRKESFKRKLD